MYNGIGLQTARGSGTNGFVQRNLSFVRLDKPRVDYKTEEEIRRFDSEYIKPPNQEILEHHRKRKIEVQCLELEEKLEKQGLSEEEIQKRIDEYRLELTQKMQKALENRQEFILEIMNSKSVKETHQLAELNRDRNDKLKSALGIGDDFVAGSSMDIIRKAKEQQAAKEQTLKENKDLIQATIKEQIEQKPEVDTSSKKPSKSQKSTSSSSSSTSSSSSSSSSSDSSSSEESSSSSSDSSDDSSSSSDSESEEESPRYRYDSRKKVSSSDPRHRSSRDYHKKNRDYSRNRDDSDRNSSPDTRKKIIPVSHRYGDKPRRRSSSNRPRRSRSRSLSSSSSSGSYHHKRRSSHHQREKHDKRGTKRRNRSFSSDSDYRSPSPPVVRSKIHKKYSRSRTPSIPRRQGSPSFLEKRRITSARKRPVPYRRNGSSVSSPSTTPHSSSLSNGSSMAWDLSPPLRYLR